MTPRSIWRRFRLLLRDSRDAKCSRTAAWRAIGAACQKSKELARCDAEMRNNVELLRAGHQDMEGLLQGLQDWEIEKGLIRRQLEGTEK